MNVRLQISWVIFAASSTMTAQQPATAGDPQGNPPAVQPVQAPEQAPTPASPMPQTSPEPAAAGTSSQRSTAPASASGNPASGVDSAHYRIGPEDALQITVWHEPTLSGTLPVRPDGMISMVLLGDVPAAGMTPTQLGADIGQRLRKFVQDPSVTVQVMGVNSQRIYLMGEVGHVGPVPLTAGMTPLQAIATAGGLSPFANSKHIYILRGTGSSQQKLPFNYKQALKGDNRQQIELRPGDTIVVP